MPRRFRVLHVIDSLDLGGAQAVVLNLLRHGKREEFAFEVACLHGHGVFWEELTTLGVPTRSLSFHHLFPSYVPALAWLCLTRRYDLVHTHLLASNVIAKPVAALSGVGVRINHDHCNDKRSDPRWWAAEADRITNRFSTHVIAVSESTREYLLAHENLPPDRVTTIHNGVDLEVYKPRPKRRAVTRSEWQLPAEAYIIAGIGRLTYQKNFSLFLEVAAEVSRFEPQTFFILAGTGEEEPKLRQQARELGIEKRVRFLGYVKEMSALYPALDMLLLTSRYEGLPITVLEAMAGGIPIVAARLDGVQEILTDEKDALLATPGDRTAFVSRVLALVQRPEAGKRYAEAALATVEAEYSAQTMTRRVETIYSHYLNARR